MHDTANNLEALIRECDDLRRELAASNRLDTLIAAFLDLVKADTDTPELLRQVVNLLARGTGFMAVGLRLREGSDYPYFQTRGLSEAFIRLENSLCPQGNHQRPAGDRDGAAPLECACGMVIEGRIDRNEPFFTEYGSLWTNSNTELLRARPQLREHIRGNCLAAGYESSALIPLRCEATTHGLLQLEDKRPGRFTPQLLRGLELIARHLALALSQREALEALRADGRTLSLRLSEGAKALNASEARFRTLANTIPQLAWMARADGHIVWYNDRWYAYTGTTPEEMEGSGWQRVHDPATLPAVLEQWKASIATGQPFDMVFPLRGADGRLRPFLTRVNPLRDATGQVLQWFGTNTDISQQKALEAELRQREEQLRLYITHAPAAIAMFDKDMRYLAASQRWVADFGLAGQPLLGRSHYEVFPEIPEHWKDIHRRCLAGAVERAEEDAFVRADGASQWLRWEVRPWYTPEGAIGGIAVFSEDITARKLAQQALAERELQFQKVFQASPAPMAILSFESGRFVHANDAYLGLLGYAPDELLGKTTVELGIWDDPQARRRIRKRFAAGKPIVDAEVRLRAKTGENINALLSIEPITIANSVHMLAVTKDITERKLAEQRLRQARDVLEDRVQARTQELEARTIELDKFFSVSSHDLQEPLRKIRVFGERLRLEYADALGDTGRDYLRRMENAATRMQTLINGLLEYSRASRNLPRFAPADLGEIAGQAARDFEPGLAAAGGHIEIGALPQAEVDGALLNQVFRNLFSNALKYHGQTPPVVRVSGAIVSEAGMQWARFSVTDNGIGFDLRFKNKIFQPFQRLHGNTAYAGTGIGLAIVRRIVELHRGTITVDSAPGQGARFIVSLPVSQPGRGSGT
ncbi:MAG: PAS domain S-box protein [Solidesulfovibrio sp. DCME]|uniref:PAS domain S-box protein n=1 Tax=Solidesulfovibrio sp. DCME TaxID=3447380 RepID=UPI003D12BAD5